ncbi:hypothetical protein ACQEVB_12085 [Pseudonocardia sp. CA-107938]|uniref:hypothetical protein n=1 Tax=Pseudonocardia sp. CA-107938 TaxID=3240021 RepID=UPI003D94FBCC
MRAEFLGKDPNSKSGGSPAAYATNRADRRTYLIQGWRITDGEALADVGHVPDHEGINEVPVEVLRLVAVREGWITD